MPYEHLRSEEREVIAQLAGAGESFAGIAAVLGRCRSSISREMRRNSMSLGAGLGRVYLAGEAERRARTRQRERRRGLKLEEQRLKQRVEGHLRQRWSPEQIAMVLKAEGVRISHETIYSHVQRDFRGGGGLYRCLRLRRRLRRRRCASHRFRIPGRISIHERPAEVQQRLELGHWEGDTMICPGGRIVTLVERVSRYVLAMRVSDGRSSSVIRAIRRRMGDLPAALRLSLTTDNGSEFTGHAELSRHLGLRVYFADPHSPWQRGSNENSNGLLRQFFPKRSGLTRLSQQRLAWAVGLLNNRPRKVLSYQTPASVLFKPPDGSRLVALQT